MYPYPQAYILISMMQSAISRGSRGVYPYPQCILILVLADKDARMIRMYHRDKDTRADFELKTRCLNSRIRMHSRDKDVCMGIRM